MDKRQAIAKMAAFIRRQAGEVPAGQKAAETQRNTRLVNRLVKLAASLERHKSLFKAVDEVYYDKSAAYRHCVVSGLVHGLKKELQASRFF